MVDVGAIGGQVVDVLYYVVIVGGIALTLSFIGWYAYRWKRYNQFNVIWFDQDGISGGSDKAGIFVDTKTKNKRFFLQKANVGLDPDNVPWKMMPSGLFGAKRTVYLLRTGLKNFQFLFIDVKPNPGVSISVGEEDVNWAINAYERQKKVFAESLLIQLLPYFALAFVSIIILILFFQLFKNFDVLKDVALALKEAAQAVSGTTVIQ